MVIEMAAATLICLSPADVQEELQSTGHEFAFVQWLSPDLTLYYYVAPDGQMTTIGDWPSKGAKGWCLHQTRSEALRSRLEEHTAAPARAAEE